MFFPEGEKGRRRRYRRMKKKKTKQRPKATHLHRQAEELRLHFVVNLLVLALSERDEDAVDAPLDCWSFFF